MKGKYLSLTSYRRDGTGVATPVWFVEEGGRILVKTDLDSYKYRLDRRVRAVDSAADRGWGHGTERGDACAS